MIPNSSAQSSNLSLQAASVYEVVGCSSLFCLIGTIGIVGNVLVIFIILSDLKMRQSVTNLYIINLAISDLVFMTLGIPEIVQFMMNRGWLLGLVTCKIQRYIIVSAFYGSVLTLVSVSIERYIAIVYPIKAHLLCAKSRTVVVILAIWTTAFLTALPTVLFNSLSSPLLKANFKLCVMQFPGDHYKNTLTRKYAEFVMYYAGPLVIQICCYLVIGRRLFGRRDNLLRKAQRKQPRNGVFADEANRGAIGARKSVIKMLVACIVVYFVSYSPHQILLFYNTFSPTPFHETWGMYVFVTICAYICSAANPVIYCIFSGNFRRRFRMMLFMCWANTPDNRQANPFTSTQYTDCIGMSKIGGRQSSVNNKRFVD